MRADQADLILALEGSALVRGVYALSKPGWPSTIVVMTDDSAHALGAITGMIVRALPHRDRSHIGVAAETRLRELWIPLASPLVLTHAERAAATERAAARNRAERAVVTLPVTLPRTDPLEPAPVSVPVLAPFERGRVWTLASGRVVALEVQADPFREQPPLVLVVTGDDAVFARVAATAPKRVRLVRAISTTTAVDATAHEKPQRIVCSEDHALGDGGFLAWIERERPELVAAFEIMCSERSIDWVRAFLAKRNPHVRIVEDADEPVDDEPLDNEFFNRE